MKIRIIHISIIDLFYATLLFSSFSFLLFCNYWNRKRQRGVLWCTWPARSKTIAIVIAIPHNRRVGKLRCGLMARYFLGRRKKEGESSQKFPFSLSRTNSFSFLLKKRGKVVESKVAWIIFLFSLSPLFLTTNRWKCYANRCKSLHFISIYRRVTVKMSGDRS